MAAEDDGKSEEPTGRKLAQARDDGDVAHSQEIKTAAILIATLAVVWMVAPYAAGHIAFLLKTFISQSYELEVGTPSDLLALLVATFTQLAPIMAIPLIILLVFGVTANIGQTGMIWSLNKLSPSLDRLNPVTALKRMFGMQGLVELIKNVAKISVVGTIVYLTLAPRMGEIEQLPSLDLVAILVFFHQVLVRVLFAVVITVIIMAVLDWFYQRYAFNQKMKMTKQEVKDEHRQTEGDPMIKARIRSLRAQRARQRMMQAVPKADVVVTNPTHFAIALKYDMDTMSAPMLVAKGQDLVAIRIRQIAQENEVPIVENAPLARALHATVEIDEEIPPEHYKAVAEVISYVFKLKGKLRQ